jgi:hypothetical protein
MTMSSLLPFLQQRGLVDRDARADQVAVATGQARGGQARQFSAQIRRDILCAGQREAATVIQATT